MTVNKVSDANFDAEVLKATGPVVVDFWAEWCGPCRMIAPALEEIAGALGEKVKIVKLNVDENPATASKSSRSSAADERHSIVRSTDGSSSYISPSRGNHS